MKTDFNTLSDNFTMLNRDCFLLRNINNCRIKLLKGTGKKKNYTK